MHNVILFPSIENSGDITDCDDGRDSNDNQVDNLPRKILAGPGEAEQIDDSIPQKLDVGDWS